MSRDENIIFVDLKILNAIDSKKYSNLFFNSPSLDAHARSALDITDEKSFLVFSKMKFIKKLLLKFISTRPQNL
jgi:hypothetical protein